MRFFLSLLLIMFSSVSLSASPIDVYADILRDDMCEYLRKKIEDAQVIVDPFPHIVIENFFSEDFYQCALKYYPIESQFYASRLCSNYGCLESSSLSTDQKVFWHHFGEVIVNRFIKPRLIDKLKPFFHLKLNMEKFPCESLDYNRDFMNYRQDSLVLGLQITKYRGISAHVDQLNLFAALLIYFPTDDQHQECGTIFYNSNSSADVNTLYADDGLDLQFAKKIPYKPNTLLCFLQTPFAWHGADLSTAEMGYLRHLYLAPIFLSPEFMNRHYKDIYRRTMVDDYFFDNRFLNKENWMDIWSGSDAYK